MKNDHPNDEALRRDRRRLLASLVLRRERFGAQALPGSTIYSPLKQGDKL